VSPFDESGRGFRDAIILDSIVADLHRRPDTRGIFVSKDSDFDLKRANLALSVGTLTIMKTLDELNDWIDKQLDTKVRDDLAAQEAALRQVVESKRHIFAEFLAANLVLSQSDLGLLGVVRSLDGLKIRNVGALHFPHGGGPDYPAQLSVDLQIEVSVTYNATVPPPERRFKIGSELPQPPMTLEQALGYPAVWPATAQRELTVTVDAELTGPFERTVIKPTSVRIKQSFASGLLGMMSRPSDNVA
jgi:hypothetical protein